jgi:O-antigen ligase
MSRALFFSRCYYILLGLAVLSIPFTSVFYFFITPLLLILWIIEDDFKIKLNRLKESHTLIITCALALFWLMNIIGLCYSNDLVTGLMRTYDKLPFLVYPLVLFTLDKTCFTEERVHYLFKAFLCATIIMLLICWGNAIAQYIATGNITAFYYIHFSAFFGHPTYCACMVSIAFGIAFYFLNNSKNNRWLWVALSFFYGISVYFLQSKSGMFAYIIILILSLFFYLNNHKKEYRQVAGMFLAVLLITALLIKVFPFRIEKYVSSINLKDMSSAEKLLGLRSEIWQITYQLAMENKMLGIGTGYHNGYYLSDSDAEVININSSFINAHNQLLQTFLEHGILGLLLLLFIVCYSFYYAVKNREYLLLILMITIFINMFFESMLERHKGICTFCLFYSLFVIKNNIFATACSKQALILDQP